MVKEVLTDRIGELNLIEELKLITGAINRMAKNSRDMKIAMLCFVLLFLVSGGLLFYASALIAVCMFAWLDGYYLSLERGFRNFYTKRLSDGLNSLESGKYILGSDMKPIVKDSAFKLIFTRSILPFYSIAVLLIGCFVVKIVLTGLK